jgi:hypothetical protein
MPAVPGHDIQPAAPGWSRPAFWRALVLTWAITLGFAAILNVVVDPFGIYGTGVFPRAQVNNYEEKLKLFDEFQPPPQALILGSSRVMSLDPETVTRLTGKRCFNFSVPGAKTETYYAILELALEHGAPIDTLIIGAEPEAFHPTLPIEPEARFVPEYSKHFIHDPHGQATFLEKLSLILTLDQVSESISSLTRLFKSKTGQSKLEYRPDGFSVEIEREAEIAAGTFDLNARIDSRIRKYPERSMRLSKFKGLSERRKQYWTDLLNLCRERGIRLYVIMPPAHPRLVRLLDELGAGGVFKEVADYLSSTVSGAGGIFRDYTRIESFGGDPSLFYDEIHVRPANGDRLLEKLLTQQ